MLEGHEQWKQDLVDKGAKQATQAAMRLGRLLTLKEAECLAVYLAAHPMTIEQIAQASPAEVEGWIAPAGGTKNGTNGRKR